MPAASKRRGVRIVRIATRSQKAAASAQYRAGRVKTSAAAALSRSINPHPRDHGARSICWWAETASRAVARQPARVLQELDESEHGSWELAPAQVDDVPVASSQLP